jgi:signal transduction histidine kinase/ligand-binding sensor domain-containing protein
VTRYADGAFMSFTTRDGLPIDGVSYIQGDRRGRLWLATSEGLVRYQNGRFRTFTTKDGLPFNAISRIIEDRDGDIWFGTRGGLIRYRDDAFTAITTDDGLPDKWIRTIRETADGSLWVGTGFGGLARVRDGRVVAAYSMSNGLPSNNVNCLSIDRAGTLWVGTDRGLARFDGDSFTTYTTRDGLSDDNINTIFEDREGNLWIGTNTGGLNRMKPRKLTAFSREQGLPGDGVVPVTEDRDGTLWIGMTCGGLVRYRDGRFTSYGMQDGLRNDCVWSLLADRQGNVWFGTWGGGLTKFRDGTFTSWRKDNSNLASDAVLALYEDRHGVMWVGTSAGLHRFKHGVFTVYRVRDGLVANDVRFITEDREGALWVGTTGGVSRFKEGAFTNYTTGHGLVHNYVRAIHQTADGTMWFGTYGGGLDRFRDGRFTHYTARDGLFGNVVSRILEDERGNFWMTGNKGIFRVARQDLDDFADRKRSSITSVPYGVADGMVNSECNGGGQPAGWKRRDGTLWFPTARGVVRIDPASVASNTVAPRVAIERVLVNRTEVNPRGTLRGNPRAEIEIPPGGSDLEIFYTGLSYSAPEHVRFKYMLAGLDDGWTDAGTRRSVYYSHLPPGNYTFRVIAANGDGVWNTTGSHIGLRIVPAFYQTWWFVVFVGVSAATLGFAIHDRRVRILTRAKAAQEAFSRGLIESQEAERKRIAAELHDSLSQTLVVIKNRAQLSLQSPDDHRRAFDQMDEIAEAATDAIDEVKEIAYNLRPFHLDRLGLTAAIDVMLANMADAHGFRVVKELDPLDGVFPKDEEINIYRIVQEALTNIVKHAAATEVRVTITRGPRSVAIAIEDNGQGFVREAPAAAMAGAGKGGFGLQGMAERARLFGGEPIVHSVPGQGTSIRLTLDVVQPNGSYGERQQHVKGDHGERRPDPARG